MIIYLGVYKLRDYIWDDEGNLAYPDKKVTLMNTKDPDLKAIYPAAHMLYGGTLENIRNNKQLGTFTKGDPELFVIKNKVELFDVDTQEDFKIAEAIYEKGL